MLFDIILVASVSFAVQITISLFNHYYVFTTPRYIELRKQIASLQRVLEQIQSKVVGAKKEQQKLRDQNVVQQQLSEAHTNLFYTTIISSIFVLVLQVGTFYALSTYLAEVVLFKLPFEVPFSFLRMWTHRGISSTDYSEVSYLPVYVLCGMLFTRLIRNYSGLEAAPEGPGFATLWNDAMKSAEKYQ